MRYLLDTHVLIWSIFETEKISKKTLSILEDPTQTIYVSPISFWEIAIKEQLGKFAFNGVDIRHLPNIADEYGFEILTPDSYDFVTYKELPLMSGHKDPFDRMLIHCAIRNNLKLVSADDAFKAYEEHGLQLMW